MRPRAPILRTSLRAAIAVTALAEIARGELLYGAYCLVALLVTLIPAIHARDLDAGIPPELEFALLWLMFADMTLGNSLGLYTLPWFDKALHLSSSLLLATLAFLVVYVLHLTNKTRFYPWVDGLAILLVTLGLGALWEISEFAVDRMFARHTQSAPLMTPLDDTMFDLILDGIGGVLGAIFGPLYMRRSKRSRALAGEFAGIVARRAQVLRGT